MVYLGLDGVTDEDTHLWLMEKVDSVDIGTLATSNYDFGGSADATTTTNSCIGSGSWDLTELGDGTDPTAQITTAGGAYPIPSAMDGTVSFLVGGIAQIDSMPGTDTFANIVSKAIASGYGWTVSARDAAGASDDSAYLNFVCYQRAYGSQTNVISGGPPPVGINYGEPFCWLCGLDTYNGELFMVTSRLTGSERTSAWTDIGTFNTTDPVRIGESAITGVTDAYNGLIALLFTLEWPSTTDIQPSVDMMDTFLQYCDGYLTV